MASSVLEVGASLDIEAEYELRSQMLRRARRTGDWELPTTTGTIVPKGLAETYSECLDAVYGEVPRRVSMDTAMSHTIVIPMLTGEHASAPYPSDDTPFLGGSDFYHHHENEATLAVGAAQIAERTWISKPHRAVLETSQQACCREDILHVLRAITMCVFSASEMLALAEVLDMRAGLARICSLSSVLSEHAGRRKPEWIAEISEALRVSPPRAKLLNIEAELPVCWEDTAHGIAWNKTPKEICDMLRH